MDYGAGKECVLVIVECWDLPLSYSWWLCLDCLVLGIS